MAPVEWWASTSPSATFVAHFLDGGPQNARGDTPALCGELRRSWQPLSWFSRPEVFTPCPGCVRVAQALRVMDDAAGT